MTRISSPEASFRRLVAIALASALLGLAGCEGDDGKDGSPGPEGLSCWDLNENGVKDFPDEDTNGDGVIDVNDCRGGGGASIPIDQADSINAEVTGIEVPDGGGNPVVRLKISDDSEIGLRGLPADQIRFTLAQLSPAPAAGASSEWQSYVTTDDADADGNDVADVQAGYERGNAGTFVDNGDGTYAYTFENALAGDGAYPAGPTYDATKTHRLGLQIDRSDPRAPNNAVTDFVPAGGEVTFTRDIVDNDTCNACHDQLAFHGGNRRDIEYCVTCHNPYSADAATVGEPWQGTVNMTEMIHKIHSGNGDTSGDPLHALANGYWIYGYEEELHMYSSIGREDAPAEGGVHFSQDIRNCQTCHDENDPNTPQASNWRLVVNRTACGACHDDIDWDNNGHPFGLATPDDADCLGCHGEGQVRPVDEVHVILTDVASEKFQYNILSVTNTAPGEFPVVQFSVTDPTNGDAAYDIQNDPEWTVADAGASRLSIDIGWDTADFSNEGSGVNPGLPIQINPLFGGSTNVGDNVFEVTSATAVPADQTGSLAVAIEGHPAVEIDGVTERIAVTNAIAYFGVTDDPAVPRRRAVDIDKCNDCHSNLSLHGNNRTSQPEVCALCHNGNATDINQRLPDTDCTNELGDDDAPIDLKRMVHQLHASAVIGPVEICGFGNSAHSYEFTYPGLLNNCEGCHVAGQYYPVDPGEVHGTTIDANDPTIQTDDVAISPNAAICSSCHTGDTATTHMEQNGGDFAAGKTADSELVSAGVETCSNCHGEGRISDVFEVHGVGEFQYNDPVDND